MTTTHCNHKTCTDTRSAPDQHNRTCGCSCKVCNPPYLHSRWTARQLVSAQRFLDTHDVLGFDRSYCRATLDDAAQFLEGVTPEATRRSCDSLRAKLHQWFKDCREVYDCRNCGGNLEGSAGDGCPHCGYGYVDDCSDCGLPRVPGVLNPVTCTCQEQKRFEQVIEAALKASWCYDSRGSRGRKRNCPIDPGDFAALIAEVNPFYTSDDIATAIEVVMSNPSMVVYGCAAHLEWWCHMLYEENHGF